jgi:hypothetical protein
MAMTCLTLFFLQDEEFDFSEDSITLQDDGSFVIRGDADLEDCDAILSLRLQEEETPLKDFATLSGFLCMCSGEIPHIGDFVMCRGWSFEITHADDKKILQVHVDRLVGSLSDEAEEDKDGGPLRSFLKKNLGGEENNSEGSESVAKGSESVATESDVDEELERARAENSEAALEIERLVDSGKTRMELASEALTEADEPSL